MFKLQKLRLLLVCSAILSFVGLQASYECKSSDAGKSAVEQKRSSQDSLNEQLFQAIDRMEDEKVRSLIAQKADVNAKDKFDNTPLIAAAKNGMTETVSRLIQAGARLDEQCRFYGNTALLHALDQKREDIAQLLMLARANGHIKSEQDVTALIMAANRGFMKVVDLLLEQGVEVDVQCRHKQHSAIIHAAINGHMEAVDKLIEAKADYDLQDKKGKTALMYAAYNGKTLIVKRLIQAGAAHDLQDKKGRTALIIAASSGGSYTCRHEHRGAVKSILEIDKLAKEIGSYLDAQRGIQYMYEFELAQCVSIVNLQDEEGMTALMYAVGSDDNQEIVKDLLENNADPDIKENYQRSAIDLAIDRDVKQEMIDLLRSYSKGGSEA